MKYPKDLQSYLVVAIQGGYDLKKGKDLLKVREIVKLSINFN